MKYNSVQNVSSRVIIVPGGRIMDLDSFAMIVIVESSQCMKKGFILMHRIIRLRKTLSVRWLGRSDKIPLGPQISCLFTIEEYCFGYKKKNGLTYR